MVMDPANDLLSSNLLFLYQRNPAFNGPKPGKSLLQILLKALLGKEMESKDLEGELLGKTIVF